jgi:hypothetical protein
LHRALTHVFTPAHARTHTHEHTLARSHTPTLTHAHIHPRSEDRWNQVVGSCLTGAAMSRDKGPQGMLQGGLTYGMFAYILDKMVSTCSGA